MTAKPKEKRIPPSAEVEVIEDVFIRMRDGCRLAARIWLPRAAAKNPCPAILEYLPYRKRDGTAPRDDVTHAFWASRGYACARVDLRGCGDSDGLMRDEYTARELADGVEAIAWLASRPWCDGKVGMVGISWGGFNGLQIAALRPPALKAVVAACFTDERYNGDIHYRGGALLGDNFGWSTQMLAYSARPPDPQIVGARWRQMWIARLKNMPLLAANWLEHQWRDDFWRHGSVCEDYGAIEAAVLAIGGWADAYVDSVARLVENMRAPARGIIGPWLHKYPHIAKPRPTIPFPVEALRWWDFWLKGEKNGAMDGPRLRAYMNDSHAPASERDFTPGRWVGIESFARAPLSTFRLDSENRCLRARARRRRGGARFAFDRRGGRRRVLPRHAPARRIADRSARRRRAFVALRFEPAQKTARCFGDAAGRNRIRSRQARRPNLRAPVRGRRRRLFESRQLGRFEFNAPRRRRQAAPLGARSPLCGEDSHARYGASLRRRQPHSIGVVERVLAARLAGAGARPIARFLRRENGVCVCLCRDCRRPRRALCLPRLRPCRSLPPSICVRRRARAQSRATPRAARRQSQSRPTSARNDTRTD